MKKAGVFAPAFFVFGAARMAANPDNVGNACAPSLRSYNFGVTPRLWKMNE
jgi:hypothetical protein